MIIIYIDLIGCLGFRTSYSDIVTLDVSNNSNVVVAYDSSFIIFIVSLHGVASIFAKMMNIKYLPKIINVGNENICTIIYHPPFGLGMQYRSVYITS